MATWKKVVVSGSNISQLNNDANYLTAGTLAVPNSFSTASFNGTSIIADSLTGSLNFASSSGQGLTISANAGTDTLTFGLSAIPNTSLENDGITIAGNDISLGGSITAATILSGTGTVSGSAQVTALLPAGTVSGSAQVDGASITNNTVSFGGVSVALNGSDSTPAFDLSDATAYPGDSSLVTLGTVTSGDVSAILPAGTVSGSSQVSYTGLSDIPSGIVSASVLSSPSQGNAVLTTNGAAGSTIGLGLTTSDSPTFTDLTLSGNLYVNGTTTQVNTTELFVEDKFIILASGSASAGDGGIIIDRGSDAAGNIAFGYDSATDRWGYQNGLTDTTNAITIGTDGNSAFAGYVFTEAAHTSAPTSGEFVAAGAIYTATSGDIFIYS
jgi:hypothetical protein